MPKTPRPRPRPPPSPPSPSSSSPYIQRLSRASSISSSSSSSSSSPPSSPFLRNTKTIRASSTRIYNRRPFFYRWLLLLLLAILTTAMLLLRTLLSTALAATTSPCAVSAACYHGFRSAFSFDAHLAHHPSWMAALADATPLTALSLPGTHDTMTYALGADDAVHQCQNRNLSAQLAAGLRYLDVRARLRADDNTLRIYHGDADTGFAYQDVLLDVFAFLDAHPSEAVVVRVKQEGGPVIGGGGGGGENTQLTFEQAFNYYWHESSITAKQSARHMHVFDPAAPLPTLGQLRSKVFVLQDFPADAGGPPDKYGIAWDGPQMALEDLWVVPDVDHLGDKWAAIRDALVRAAAGPRDNKALFLSHVSASVGVLPIEAAAGPKNGTVVGMNDETGRWLVDGEDKGGRTGVVIFDFPGKRAIEAVLARNAPFRV